MSETALSSGADAPCLAVVIPYYQREAGLLRACVESVLSQVDAPPCLVVVVDDESPRPAEAELADLQLHNDRIRVVRQLNAGPGAARNRALQEVPASVPFVAFLDSDDRWQPHFAATALRAFEAGADMFFANSVRFGTTKSRFEWDHASGVKLEAGAHDAVEGQEDLYLFRGDFFDFAVRRSGIISTSTLAFRRAAAPALRFETRLFNGQDRLFKLQLACVASKCAFSTRVGAVEGRGINIFDSAQWGASNSLVLLVSYIRLARFILRDLPLNASQRLFVQAQLGDLRRDLARTVLHQLRRGKPVRTRLLGQCFVEDPMTAWLFLPHAVQAVWQRGRTHGNSGSSP